MKKSLSIVLIFSSLFLFLSGVLPAFSFSGSGSCPQATYYVKEIFYMDPEGNDVYAVQFDSGAFPGPVGFTDERSFLKGIDLPLIIAIETQKLVEEHKQRTMFLSSV